MDVTLHAYAGQAATLSLVGPLIGGKNDARVGLRVVFFL